MENTNLHNDFEFEDLYSEELNWENLDKLIAEVESAPIDIPKINFNEVEDSSLKDNFVLKSY